MSEPGDAAADPGLAAAPSSPFAPTRVLVVDHDRGERDVICALLSEEGYLCGAAVGAEQAVELLHENEFHLVVAELKTPGKDGFWLLDRIRHDQPLTGVIMLTSLGDTQAAVECLRRGASDYLLKPPKVTELVRSIERALARRRLELARQRYRTSLERRVREKTAELSRALREVEAAYASTLAALVAALDAREHETSDHSQRVVRFTLAMAERVGIPTAERADVARGALLHDIGKIGVPDAILLKPGPLGESEWEEMRRHPQTGYTILQSTPFLQRAAELVLSHQERWDGGGYPRGLAGEKIPLAARVFAIADTVDAMTRDRPYRRGVSFDRAREEIRRCAGTQFDPRCVEAFLSMDGELFEALRRSDAQARTLGSA